MGLKHLFALIIHRKICMDKAPWNETVIVVTPKKDVQNSPKAMIGVGGGILCVLLAACLLIEAAQIEDDLGGQVRAYAEQSGFDWLVVQADGQNLILSGSAPYVGDRRDVLGFSKNVWGVANVTNNILLLGQFDTCQLEFDRYLSVGSIEFGSSGEKILSKSLPLIDRLSDIARNCNARIRISGHTDSTGGADANLRLSTARAQNVRKHMLARGVSPRQVTAVGYGESRPVANNSTLSGREKNRRIEIRVTGRT